MQKQKTTPNWGLVLLASGPDGHLIRHPGLFPLQKWAKKMARPISFLLVSWCVVLISTPPPPLSLFFSKEVLSLFAMPKVDPRNEVGAIILLFMSHMHALLDLQHGSKSLEQLTSYGRSWAPTFWEASLGIGIFNDFCPLLAFDS